MSRAPVAEMDIQSPALSLVPSRSQGLLDRFRVVLISILGTVASLFSKARLRATTRRLKVTELTQLGDKRFVGIVEFEGRRLLIGGSGATLCLLADLGKGESFSSTLADFSKIRELA